MERRGRKRSRSQSISLQSVGMSRIDCRRPFGRFPLRSHQINARDPECSLNAPCSLGAPVTNRFTASNIESDVCQVHHCNRGDLSIGQMIVHELGRLTAVNQFHPMSHFLCRNGTDQVPQTQECQRQRGVERSSPKSNGTDPRRAEQR